MHVQQSNPSPGWIRGDRPRLQDEREIFDLKSKISDLEKRLGETIEKQANSEPEIEKIRELFDSLEGTVQVSYYNKDGDVLHVESVERKELMVYIMVAVRHTYKFNQVNVLLAKVIEAFSGHSSEKFASVSRVRFGENGDLSRLLGAMEIAGCYSVRTVPVAGAVETVVSSSPSGAKWLISRFSENPRLQSIRLRQISSPKGPKKSNWK